jgi:hypothetical protein
VRRERDYKLEFKKQKQRKVGTCEKQNSLKKKNT